MNEKSWNERKNHFIRRLKRDIEMKRVDNDILDLLNLINSLDNYYTLSSCSGRIQFLEGPSFSDRKALKNLGKFHESVDKQIILDMVSKSNADYLWVSVQAPILHVACKNLNSAYSILKIARSKGFKHSGILAMDDDRYVVELNSSIRIDFPIKYAGKLLINFKNIDVIVDLLNNYLLKSKKIIKNFQNEILKMSKINDKEDVES